MIEGPQFSTRAESAQYRSWGADVIGMTALPEAKLAREAEICYATLAFVTDYDVWREAEEDVSVEMVVANLMKNVETARAIIRKRCRAGVEGAGVRLRYGARNGDNHTSGSDIAKDTRTARPARGQVSGLAP